MFIFVKSGQEEGQMLLMFLPKSFWKINQQCIIKKILKLLKGSQTNVKVTSAQAFGRTRRPMRPASLALRTFSNNGTIVEFELAKYSQGRQKKTYICYKKNLCSILCGFKPSELFWSLVSISY
jgi:hypothetical protein